VIIAIILIVNSLAQTFSNILWGCFNVQSNTIYNKYVSEHTLLDYSVCFDQIKEHKVSIVLGELAKLSNSVKF
jgi:hypothetical protein